MYNRPQVHEWLREMKTKILNQCKDFMSARALVLLTSRKIRRYIRDDRNELDMIFQIDAACIDFGQWGVFSHRDWDLGEIKRGTREIQRVPRSPWNIRHLENHGNVSCLRWDHCADNSRGDQAKYKGDTNSAKIFLEHLASGGPRQCLLPPLGPLR